MEKKKEPALDEFRRCFTDRTELGEALEAAARETDRERVALPEVSVRTLDGLRCNAALPKHLAERTVSARSADVEGTQRLLKEPTRFTLL